MSNQANTQVKGFDVEKMKDDELLKLEAEMKAKLELLQKAKAEREEKIKEASLSAIKQAIDKVIADGVVSSSEITSFLVAEGYVVAPKAAATSAGTGSGKGRRAISDEDVLFSFAYTGEGGRNMTLKLDAESKLPAPQALASKVLKDLQTKTFEELKQHFTPKFINEFMLTEESIEWIDRFFPKIQDTVQTLANKAVKAQ